MKKVFVGCQETGSVIDGRMVFLYLRGRDDCEHVVSDGEEVLGVYITSLEQLCVFGYVYNIL